MHVGVQLESQLERRDSAAVYTAPQGLDWGLGVLRSSDVRSQQAVMGMVAGALVDEAYTYCCILAVLEQEGFACTDSSVCSYTQTVLLSGLGPVPLERAAC